MGENAEELVVFIGDNGGARPGVEHRYHGVFYGSAGLHDGEIGIAAHDVGDFGEKIFSEISSGMESGEVFRFEAALFQENHCKRIAEGEHIGRAGSGSEPEGAGFLLDPGAQNNVAVFGESGLGIAGDGNDGSGPLFDVREERSHLGSFPAIAQCDDEVVGGEDAKIAMKGILAAEIHRRSTGAVEGGHEFFSDAFGLSDTDDDDFLLTIQRFVQGFDCFGKVFVNSVGQKLQLGDLNRKDRFGFLDEVGCLGNAHGGRVPEGFGKVNLPQKLVWRSG